MGGSAIWSTAPPYASFDLVASGFVDPMGMVLDPAGNLYVADYDSGGRFSALFKVAPDGTKTQVAAFPWAGNSTPNITCVTRDASGNLYVGEYLDQKIDKVTPAGVVSTYVPVVGTPGATRLVMVHMDTDGTMCAGTYNGAIYKIGPGGSPVTVFCGVTGAPAGFDRGPDGNWYVSTYDGMQIYRVTPAGATSVYAGIYHGPGAIDGPVLTARFNDPSQIAFYGGRLFIADYDNQALRVIDDVASPTRNSTWGRIKAEYR